MKTERSAHFLICICNPLSPIEKVILETVNYVFVYTEIIEKYLFERFLLISANIFKWNLTC